MGSANDAFVIAEWRDARGPPGPPRLIAPLHHHHREGVPRKGLPHSRQRRLSGGVKNSLVEFDAVLP
jgi:hypothetical protein